VSTPGAATTRRARPVVVAALLSLPHGGCAGNPDAASSSGETSSDAGSSAAPPHVLEGRLPAGSYQISVFANPGDQGPEALVEVPSGYRGGATWYVLSRDVDAAYNPKSTAADIHKLIDGRVP
jgi:hypothetical protein